QRVRYLGVDGARAARVRAALAALQAGHHLARELATMLKEARRRARRIESVLGTMASHRDRGQVLPEIPAVGPLRQANVSGMTSPNGPNRPFVPHLSPYLEVNDERPSPAQAGRFARERSEQRGRSDDAGILRAAATPAARASRPHRATAGLAPRRPPARQ